MAHQGGTAIGTMPEEVELIASKQERSCLLKSPHLMQTLSQEVV